MSAPTPVLGPVALDGSSETTAPAPVDEGHPQPVPWLWRWRWRWRWKRLAPPVLAVAVYCVLGAFVYGAHSPVTSTTLPPCACEDVALQTWFQAWPAYALAHGLNPFYSAWAAYPAGVNLMDNTAAPLLGLVFAPVTWLLGPFASLSLAARLAFALSATSMFFVLRRWTQWWPAAFIGGLVYAFSPFMVGEAQAHLFLIFVPLPPIMLALLDELVVRRRRVVRNGVLLGAVATAQLLISPEVLAMSGVATITGLLVLAIRHPVAARERWREVSSGLTATAASLVVLAAYPLWVYLRGPYHVNGPQHHVSNLQRYHDAVESLIYPTILQRFGTSGMFSTGNGLTANNPVEHTAYLGLPLLCLLVLTTIRFRREGIVKLFCLVALGAWLVMLGPVLYIANSSYTAIKLPYQVVERIPLINSGLDLRYSLIMYLAISVVVAIGLDRLRRDGLFATREGRQSRPADPRARAALCLAVAVVGLLPLFPRLPYQSTPFGVPAVFTAEQSPIANGDVVLSFPLPVGYIGANDQALLWQAGAGMRFKLIGFRGALAGNHHQPLVNAAVLLPPAQAEQVLLWGLYGRPNPPPPLDAATSQAIRTFLARYNVDDVAIIPWGSTPKGVLAYFTAALGLPPQDFQGDYVWSRVQELLQRSGRRTKRS
jgi:hypothetical protein